MSFPAELAPARTSPLCREIHEKPQVIARLLDAQTAPLRRFIAGRPPFSCGLVAAQGSYDPSATYAAYGLGGLAGLPVALATPSLHTIYAAPPRLEGSLVVGISRS